VEGELVKEVEKNYHIDIVIVWSKYFAQPPSAIACVPTEVTLITQIEMQAIGLPNERCFHRGRLRVSIFKVSRRAVSQRWYSDGDIFYHVF